MKLFGCATLAWGVLVAISSDALAGGACCKFCGRAGDCRKVSRCVPEEKKVEVVCWGSESVDFCVPGPSEQVCTHCEGDVCGTCAPAGKGPSARPRMFMWKEWVPGSARVYTKKKLMKKVVTRKVPGYKWVVEDLCADCEDGCRSPEVAPSAEVPSSARAGANAPTCPELRIAEPGVIRP
jgi:hypothetical protein